MFQSINPYSGALLAEFEPFDQNQADEVNKKSHSAFLEWRITEVGERVEFIKKLAQLLRSEQENLSTLITQEMGKIIRESKAEIEKCAWLCDYYAEQGSQMLETESAPSDGTVSYLRFDPVGVVFAIMPWNFPFWQVLRFAIPTITCRKCSSSETCTQCVWLCHRHPKDF